MTYIGGDSHGKEVPEALRSQHTVEVEIQRYVRHGEYFVIFGMARHRAAELIAELNK